MIIKTENNLAVGASKTFLTSLEAAGTTVLRVRNTTSMTTSWAVQIGEIGEEQTEIVIGTAPNIGTINCPTTNFEHPADTPIYFIKYNQVVFERSTNGTAGTATPMTSGTITYQADHPFTQFDDTSGSISYAYRTYFRNSVLAVNTTESDWIVITPSFYSLAVMRQRTKNKLWDASFLKDDSQVDDWTNEFKDKLTNLAIGVNEDYSLGTVDVGFGTAGLGTVITADFKQPRRVWITYNGSDFFQSTKMNINDFLPDQTFSDTHPNHAWFGNDIIQVKPEKNGGTARITYYAQGTPMVNDTDELPRYMRGYTDAFVEYNLLQAQYKDGKLSFGEKKAAEQALVQDFSSQLAPRDKSGATYVGLVTAISGEDYGPE